MRTKVITSIIIAVMLMSILGTVLQTQAESEISEPEYLIIALLQSGTEPQYVKPIQQWFIKIYTEALSRMNITLFYRVLPPKRASLYSDQGMLDGELSRVYDYNNEFKNLIRVEEHHLLSVFSAFGTDPTITLNGWQSLKNTNYYVDYRRGIKKCAENLTAIIPSKRLSETHSIQSGVVKLLAGRTDIFIDSEDGVFDYLKTEELQRMSRERGIDIYKVGIMETVTSHFWLHKKHRDLAPRLSVILSDMKREGLFDLYLEQVGLSQLEIKW
jgi:hypothetical protein